MSDKNFVYLWVDGVHFGVRLEDASQCILVIIGATADGKKELLAMLDGYRESAESWKELLLDLKQRGLTSAPKLAVGDGALGFWKALPQVFGSTRAQRCWVHKTANVLNQLPKGQQAKAKAALHEIWMAESRTAAEQAFDRHEPDRINFRHGALADCEDTRLRLARWHPGDGFKLTKSAEHRWRKLKGSACLAQVIKGVRFKDGLQEEAQRIAA